MNTWVVHFAHIDFDYFQIFCPFERPQMMRLKEYLTKVDPIQSRNKVSLQFRLIYKAHISKLA